MTTGQHRTLSPERWATFAPDQQLLMIANEMNRAGQLFGGGDDDLLRRSLERVLALADLTATTTPRRALRIELLRWRDLVAALYVSEAPPRAEFREAFRALLLLSPAAALQIPHLL